MLSWGLRPGDHAKAHAQEPLSPRGEGGQCCLVTLLQNYLCRQALPLETSAFAFCSLGMRSVVSLL